MARFLFYLHVGLVQVAAALLLNHILTHRFDYDYVFQHSSTDLPLLYLVSTFWSGQEGTFLLWAVYGGFFGMALIARARDWEAEVMAVFTVVQLLVLGLILAHSPFAPLKLSEFSAADQAIFKSQFGGLPPQGMGLNELLHNPWMAIHPPLLFSGFASLAVPFAFALAGLWRRDDGWASRAHGWALLSWSLLGTGLILGGYWAYETLGWGGYWAWDPVENSSLVPWLLTGALFHAIIFQRVSGGAARRLTLGLAVAAFATVTYGSYLNRSGILSDFSVHSFVALSESFNRVLLVFAVAPLVMFGVAWLAGLRSSAPPPCQGGGRGRSSLSRGLDEAVAEPVEQEQPGRASGVAGELAGEWSGSGSGADAPDGRDLPLPPPWQGGGADATLWRGGGGADATLWRGGGADAALWQGEGTDSTLSRRQLLWFGILLQTGSAVVVLLGNSWPLVSHLWHKPSSLQPAFYNQVHTPLAMVIAVLLSVVMLADWGRLRSERLWEGWRIPIRAAAAALLITCVSIGLYAGRHRHAPDMLPASALRFAAAWATLIVLAVFAAAVNASVLWAEYRRGERLALGSHVAHIGFNVLLVGLVVSSVFQSKTMLSLPRDAARGFEGYELTYLGLFPVGDGAEVRVAVRRGSTELILHPRLKPSRDGMIRNPGIWTAISRDLYLAPGEIQPGQTPDSVLLDPDEPVTVGGLTVAFDKFEVKSLDPENFRVLVRLKVTRGGKTTDVEPVFAARGGVLAPEPAALPGGGSVAVVNLPAKTDGSGERQIELRLEGAGFDAVPETAVVEVTLKPGMSVVWLGCWLMIGGGLLSAVRRAGEAARRRRT